MDFSGFTGNRRPLTWVRTPLHDREIEQSNRNSTASSSISENNSDTCLTSGNTKQVTFSDNSPISVIRDLSNKLPVLKKIRKRQEKSWSGSDSNPETKLSPHKRNKKRWNMMHFVAGGQHFQSPEWIFDGHPDTLLGSVEKRKFYYNNKRGYYEFPDVLPDVFIAILEFYRTNSVARPERLTLNYFLEQIKVFKLEPRVIDCLLKNEGVYKSKEEYCRTPNKHGLQIHIWDIMENPRSSFFARMYSWTSLLVTILAVTLFIVETLPELSQYNLVGKHSLTEAFQSPIFCVSIFCFVFFTLELFLRFISCPNKRKFIRVWTNWTDLLSILPFIIVFILLSINTQHNHLPLSVVTVIRACRLFLITRVFGTSRYFHYRQHWIIILARTLWNNIETLFVLFFLMIICMVGFGGVFYALEGAGQDNPVFATIPSGMWFAVVTLTTVGYGDIVPKRAMGQMVAIVCGCVGLMFVGFVLESVTYEYHRLMKSNTQYRRYIAEQDHAMQHLQLGGGIPRVASCHASLMLMVSSTDEIHININGAEFHLSLQDIQRYPNSLLGHPSKRVHYYNPTSGSYFFSRNQDIFPAIHHYYRYPGSVLKRPPFITMQKFVEEVEFFHLPPQSVIDLFAYEGIRLIEEEQPASDRLCYWHLVLSHPQYNILSRIIMICSLLATCCFILNIVLESLPSLLSFSCSTALSGDMDGNKVTYANATNNSTTNSTNSSLGTTSCPNEMIFFSIETICTAWFLFELIARFSVAPSKRKFLKRVMNWIDLIIISPYVFTIIQMATVNPSNDHARLFSFFRAMRLLRLISIVKFSRYFPRIQMIFAILQATWMELLMLAYFMLVNAILFGTLIYLVESTSGVVDGDFNSIPRAMYWAWITMLTIGYGDMVPITAGGKVIASGVSILGIVFWTLPMTLISDHFANYRRLFEGQDYLMLCLTRMYHLLDTETNLQEKRQSLSHITSAPNLGSHSELDRRTSFTIGHPSSSQIFHPAQIMEEEEVNADGDIPSGGYRRQSTEDKDNQQRKLSDGLKSHTKPKLSRRFSYIDFDHGLIMSASPSSTSFGIP